MQVQVSRSPLTLTMKFHCLNNAWRSVRDLISLVNLSNRRCKHLNPKHYVYQHWAAVHTLFTITVCLFTSGTRRSVPCHWQRYGDNCSINSRLKSLFLMSCPRTVSCKSETVAAVKVETPAYAVCVVSLLW